MATSSGPGTNALVLRVAAGGRQDRSHRDQRCQHRLDPGTDRRDAGRYPQRAPGPSAAPAVCTSYVLLVSLVATGLVLSHPGVRRLARPRPLTRLRFHVSLAVFTLTFTVLHVVVLATDPWAHVGWRGAMLPMASVYRPVGVTLGVIAVWSGVVTGSDGGAGRSGLGRVWWPIHKGAAVAFLLVWVHGVVAGSDTPAAVAGFTS